MKHSRHVPPLQALVRCSEDVLHTLEETAPGAGGPVREPWGGSPWVGGLEALKEKLLSEVESLQRTLRAQCDFHHCYSKVGPKKKKV